MLETNHFLCAVRDRWKWSKQGALTKTNIFVGRRPSFPLPWAFQTGYAEVVGVKKGGSERLKSVVMLADAQTDVARALSLRMKATMTKWEQ